MQHKDLMVSVIGGVLLDCLLPFLVGIISMKWEKNVTFSQLQHKWMVV